MTSIQVLERLIASAEVARNIEAEAKRVQAIADTIQAKRIEAGRFE